MSRCASRRLADIRRCRCAVLRTTRSTGSRACTVVICLSIRSCMKLVIRRLGNPRTWVMHNSEPSPACPIGFRRLPPHVRQFDQRLRSVLFRIWRLAWQSNMVVPSGFAAADCSGKLAPSLTENKRGCEREQRCRVIGEEEDYTKAIFRLMLGVCQPVSDPRPDCFAITIARACNAD